MLLTIPRKKTRKLNLERSILNVVTARLGAECAARPDVQVAARVAGSLRNAAALTVLMDRANYGFANDASLRSQLEYVNAMHYIGSRAGALCLPQGGDANVEMFEWQDAFSTATTKTAEYKLDLVSCTINAGSILSAIAVMKSYAANLTEGELQETARMFCRAAGFFDYCITSMPFQVSDGTVDLHTPAHTACKYAMLANAQQLLYRSITRPDSAYPPSVRAGIAAGVREMYSVVISHCRSPAMAGSSVASVMVPSADILRLYFSAEADLRASAVAEHAAQAQAQEGQWGVHCARVRRACFSLIAAERLLPGLSSTLDEANYIPDAVRRLLQHCRQKLAHAINLNSQQFYESEPDAEGLPDIEPIMMVKAQDVSDEFPYSGVRSDLQVLVDLGNGRA